jgi:hypothetical protein
MVKTMALVFHIGIPWDKTFPWMGTLFGLLVLILVFGWLLKTLTLVISFESWVLQFLVFHTSISCDKIFIWIPNIWPRDFDLGVWTTYEFLILVTYFQWCGLEVLYFTWMLFVTRPFRGINLFNIVALTLVFVRLKYFNFAYIFWMLCTKTGISHECTLRQDLFLGTNIFDRSTFTYGFYLQCTYWTF